MEVIIRETPDELARRAADFIESRVRRHPRTVLGLATGSTPLPLYRELVRRHQEDGLSFANVITVNLDEYVGLPPDHPQSYRYFMHEHLFQHIDLDPANTHLPDGLIQNPLDAGPAYEQLIAHLGGIDIQVLGLGATGHIGFNEPTSSLGSRTRVKTLTDKTLADNQRFFGPGETPPRLAITMGIQTILDARMVLLIATGEHKSNAVADMIEGPVAAVCPASALQYHARAKVLIDRPAAAALRLSSYYDRVLAEQDALIAQHGYPTNG